MTYIAHHQPSHETYVLFSSVIISLSPTIILAVWGLSISKILLTQETGGLFFLFNNTRQARLVSDTSAVPFKLLRSCGKRKYLLAYCIPKNHRHNLISVVIWIYEFFQLDHLKPLLKRLKSHTFTIFVCAEDILSTESHNDL